MTRRVVLVVATVVLASSCAGSDGGDRGDRQPQAAELIATVASYDLAADLDTRFIVGLQTAANRLVAGGRVDMRFFFLGETRAEGEPELLGQATAEFLPLPDSAAPDTPGPVEVEPSESRGVYSVSSVSFDRPGIWEVEVTADFGGGDVRTATNAFQVLPEHQVPAPGDRALRTENLTVDSDAPPRAIDSRAQGGGAIPDEVLHRTTIADAIRAGRPIVAVFATPVYCVSKFCGPVTDMVQELSDDYGGRAEFIHVEIWRDFQGRVVNRAAAEWLLRNEDLQEPWVFAVGANGRIEERWDNVATREEIEPWLERLP
ncbi:MAG: hypothetical protein ACRDI0_07330 [Actinomycetota bacterium]